MTSSGSSWIRQIRLDLRSAAAVSWGESDEAASAADTDLPPEGTGKADRRRCSMAWEVLRCSRAAFPSGSDRKDLQGRSRAV